MTSRNTTACLPQSKIETAEHFFANWFDPVEAGLRDRAREGLQAVLEAELDKVLACSRYARETWFSTHLSPRLVTQPIQKRFEKACKLVFPIRRSANHGRPLQKPTTHESQKN